MCSLIQRALEIAGSQAELARRVGCTQQHISLILRGKRSVSGDVAIRIERATNGEVTVQDLRPDLFRASDRSAA